MTHMTSLTKKKGLKGLYWLELIRVDKSWLEMTNNALFDGRTVLRTDKGDWRVPRKRLKMLTRKVYIDRTFEPRKNEPTSNGIPSMSKRIWYGDDFYNVQNYKSSWDYFSYDQFQCCKRRVLQNEYALPDKWGDQLSIPRFFFGCVCLGLSEGVCQFSTGLMSNQARSCWLPAAPRLRWFWCHHST